MTDRVDGVEPADFRAQWASHCWKGGAALVLLFGWFMLTAEVPWREQDRAVAQGKWRVVDIPGRKQPHRATYEYEVNGRLHHGEIKCDGCLGNLRERPAPLAPMSVEFRLSDPNVSRPYGLVTEGAAQYRRIGFMAGIALLVCGLLGVVLGKPAVR